MKRIFAGMLFLLLLIFCGCTSADNSPTDGADQSESQLQEVIGIIGSDEVGVKEELVTFGFENAELVESPETERSKFVYSCDASAAFGEEETQLPISYSMKLDKDYQVISLSFEIENSASLRKDPFLQISEIYLGSCAQFSCDSADKEKAKAFIEDNLADISADNSAEIVIGDAKFELHGLKAGDYFGERSGYLNQLTSCEQK